MIKFSAKTGEGREIVGIGLGTEDILRLKSGGHIVLDLESVGVGLWVKGADGSRSFLQPRDSQIVLFPGNNNEDIGELLGVTMPELGNR